MMKFLLALIPLCLVVMGGTTWSFAEEMQPPPPYEGSPELKTMKTLAGTWKGTHLMHGKELPASVEYKVSSNGSTVVETMFPGSPHEMINVYHDKAGKLAMTHYCSVGNQPHLDLVAMEGKTLSFALSSADNTHFGDEGHMHDLKITMADPGHLNQTWSFFEKGQKGGTTTFDLVRVQ
jgi:hypothetical protein